MQPEHKREPSRSNRVASTGSGIGARWHTVGRASCAGTRGWGEPRKVVGGDGDKDAGEASGESGSCHPRAIERGPPALEKEALLRVHCGRFSSRDPKGGIVEELGADDEAAMAHSTRQGLIEGEWRPALQGYLGGAG